MSHQQKTRMVHPSEKGKKYEMHDIAESYASFRSSVKPYEDRITNYW